LFVSLSHQSNQSQEDRDGGERRRRRRRRKGKQKKRKKKREKGLVSSSHSGRRATSPPSTQAKEAQVWQWHLRAVPYHLRLSIPNPNGWVILYFCCSSVFFCRACDATPTNNGVAEPFAPPRPRCVRRAARCC
jgi:hypothetical protein